MLLEQEMGVCLASCRFYLAYALTISRITTLPGLSQQDIVEYLSKILTYLRIST
jgi:hypothetical protein